MRLELGAHGAPVLQCRRQRSALTIRERADLLVLRQAHREQATPAPSTAPAALTHQKIADRHALCLPRAVQHDVCDRSRLSCHPTLELGPCQSNLVRLLERPKVLRRSLRRGGFAHDPPRGYGLQRCRLTLTSEALRPPQPALSLGPPSDASGPVGDVEPKRTRPAASTRIASSSR